MRAKTPPGPAGHFLTGSLPEFRRDMLGFFTRCAREYGDVSAFSLFHIRGCLVNSPELIQEVLVSKNDRMAKPWDVRELKLALGEGLLTNEGEAWRRQRRLIEPAFHHERVRSYAEIMSARAKRTADAWHPEVEARLADELDAVLGGRTPRADDVPRLTFTRQVVQEAMRLYPPAWGIAREALDEIELGGYRIPRGTQIFMVQYVTHRDPRFFAQPEEFLPDRWSPAEAKKIPKYAYFPFGGGSRHCIGSSFAMMEATVLLAVLMQRCHFELVPEHPIELQPAVTLRPRHGIRAVIQRPPRRASLASHSL